MFVGRILLCGFFFVQKLCADRFRNQQRRVTEFVFYREIAQSKVEVQAQYMSGHDRCSFHDFFFNIGLKIGHCAQYVRKCLRFVSLFTACLVWELSVIPAHYCSVLRLFGYVLPFSLSFPSDSFPTIFPTIIVHEFHIFAMRAICPAHRIRVPLYCPRTQDVQPVSPPLEIRSAV